MVWYIYCTTCLDCKVMLIYLCLSEHSNHQTSEKHVRSALTNITFFKKISARKKPKIMAQKITYMYRLWKLRKTRSQNTNFHEIESWTLKKFDRSRLKTFSRSPGSGSSLRCEETKRHQMRRTGLAPKLGAENFANSLDKLDCEQEEDEQRTKHLVIQLLNNNKKHWDRPSFIRKRTPGERSAGNRSLQPTIKAKWLFPFIFKKPVNRNCVEKALFWTQLLVIVNQLKSLSICIVTSHYKILKRSKWGYTSLQSIRSNPLCSS